MKRYLIALLLGFFIAGPAWTIAQDIGRGPGALVAGDADIGNVDLEFAGTAAATNAGVNGADVLRVTIATDDEMNDSLAAALTSLQLLDNALFVDDADFTDGTSSLLLAGCVAEVTSTTVTDGDIGACSMTLSRALKVTLYNSSGTELTSTEVAEDAAETAGVTGPMVLGVRRDVAASSSGASGDNSTLNLDALGLLWTRSLDPCSGVAKSFLPVSISTATTTEITPSLAGASTNYYICSVNLVTDAANDVLIADDDSDNCASPSNGIFGSDASPAASEGWNFGASGGISLGDGDGSVGKTQGTNRVICVITSAATQLSGMIVVAAAP